MVVSVATQGSVAVVTIDNPPVNASSQEVRAGLVAAVAETEADDRIKAVVLCAAGRTFTAGADVKEFGKPARKPHLPDVIDALESARKPWVAALHGTALGGGLEIALGCAYRVADPKAKMGFPEVNLGLIPGAGGTVRLPRLIAPEEAVQMVAGGRPIAAAKAKALGLVDEIAEGDLTEFAIGFAQQVAGKPLPQPLSLRDAAPISDADAWAKLTSGIVKKARGASAPGEAIAAVETALSQTAEAAFAAERETFLRLKDGQESTALRYIFFAERASARMPELDGIAPLTLTEVGVIGGGTMGAGIAAACLLAGLRVVLIERDEAALSAGKTRIMDILDGSLKRGLLDPVTHENCLNSLRASTGYDALRDADLVIEAVFEDMAVKEQVFAEIGHHVRADAILASNTSYLDLNALAATTNDRARIIGLHFFSPAHIMKLLEVVVTDHASPTALATAFALGKRLKKISVPAGVCDGFIGNRIMSAYRRECEYMVEDGALPWAIDAAMRDYGFPMGMFEMQDLAGLDISWAMRKRQAATRDPAERYVDLGDKLCEAGRLGRKAQEGWYEYPDGKAVPSPWVEALIQAEADRKGITQTAIPADEIMSRILGVMQSEAAKILDEGIAKRADDIDVVMVNGYGFPRWRGGPVFLSRSG